MTEKPTPEEDLADEFRSLGKNLVEALRSAWDSPERRRLQQELETNLTELGATLKQEADNFTSSPSGQQLRVDVEQLGEQLRNGEAQQRARQELFTVLRTINTELQKAIDNWSKPPSGEEPGAPPDSSNGQP
ncbi:MAG: hypothetical protein JXB15_07550 [Anaerolineales bacterium]|nr:hypothetical protein [Anaerolineales bacterium]